MRSTRQKKFLAAVFAALALILIVQVYFLWQTLQKPVDAILSQAELWVQLGLVFFIPSTTIGGILNWASFRGAEREVYERPVVINSVFAGVLFLVATWMSARVGSIVSIFWIFLALASFTAPLWVKTLLARIGIKQANSE